MSILASVFLLVKIIAQNNEFIYRLCSKVKNYHPGIMGWWKHGELGDWGNGEMGKWSVGKFDIEWMHGCMIACESSSTNQ